MPRVSVITPAYNASATILDTVSSALAQTVEDLEIVVVDDGSTQPVADALADLRDPRLRVIRSEVNRGVSTARNIGLAAARSAVFAQLDSDDLWHPDHLEGVLPALDDPAVGLAYTNAEFVGSSRWAAAIAERRSSESQSPPQPLPPVNDLTQLYRANPVPSPSVVMRTAPVRALGGYPRWLTGGEEYYLYIKLRRAGWRFAYVDRMSAVYRMAEPSRGASFDVRRMNRQSLKLFTVLALSSAPNAAIYRRIGVDLLDLFTEYVPVALPVGRRLRALTRRR
jgi:glycosyltransferase involved in cell wall biosynthesis